MPEEYIDHDAWNYGLAKLPKAPKVKLGAITGVLPFDGARNPGFRSAVAHRVWLTYKTSANDWRPKVGICESAAEAAVAYEALIAKDTYDVKFQPLTIQFEFDGKKPEYTHDLLVTRLNTHRRLIFVRNEASLSKPKTWREIEAIVRATPPSAADDMIVVNANDYSRQRRENLYRMYQMIQERDEEADEIVLYTALNLKTLWLMKDLFSHIDLPQWRVFRSCYRLIAREKLIANMDHVINEFSRVSIAA
ncbi:hypothetical protein [Roseovarius sp. Pro17]|uniref:hypothetical protein n=1 Tax=Roseovarius sp. Pro17 TaxID=3108175 RepID=UPI002D796160|nr:hypothetical protein [Roseovarius sp. Pro17]